MTRVVLLTGTWDAATKARISAVARAIAASGGAVTVIAPASPSEFDAGPGVGFIPARRRDDAEIALSHLAAQPPILIECFDAAAGRCAMAWRQRAAGPPHAPVPVLIDVHAIGDDPVWNLGDAVLAPTRAHAARCAGAGLDPDRVFIARTPVTPTPSFAPGGEAALCLTPIAPDRGLVELIDAWAASGPANEGVWTLRLGGPIEDAGFARAIGRRIAACPGIAITERINHPEHEVAGCAVLIDTEGVAAPAVLEAAVRARAVFAPHASPTAEIACEQDGPYTYDLGVRGLIGVFDLLSGRRAADFAEPGQRARERILATNAAPVSTPARARAHQTAAQRLLTNAAPPAAVPIAPVGAWGGRPRGRQNPDHTARLERAMLACRSEGLGRIALYGAGDFAKCCADALCEPPIEVIGFIDDDLTKQGTRIWGFPVLCADVALTGSLDAVILTAPSCEEALWQRTAWFRQARVRVIPLVREHPDIAHARAA